MKVFIVGSKRFFDKVPPVKEELERLGHVITVPSGYSNPDKEFDMQKLDEESYINWKRGMLEEQGRRVAANDALLVMNFDKDGQLNYIGGATFLEIFKAWELGRKIFFYNPIPDSILTDEIRGLAPIVINGDLSKVL
jgi:hypothetical protein